MKKILALLIVLTLVVSMFTGCEFPELPFGPETPDDQVTPDDGNNDQNNDTTEGSTLEDAKTVLRDLYKDKLATTAVNFTVVTQVMVGEDKYEVIWSTNNDKIVVGEPDADTKSVTIAVPSQAVEKIEYVLTATIKAADGTTLEVNFDAAVPKFEVNSHADYMAAVKDDELTIMGVVVGINSVARGNKYNHLFLADTSVDGGYYCYKVTTDPSDLGIELGMTVAVTGKMSPYNGMQEIINGQVEVLDTTIRSFETLDITDKFAAGADLGAYVGLPVSIKGVTLGSQDLETANSQYLYFSIGEKQAYVRTYITDFPVDLQANRDAVKATIDADHAAHFGYKADVEGILVLFSGNPYLIPTSVTPFTNYKEVEKTPAEKVAAEIGELKFDASYAEDAIIDLLLTGKYYNDVTLTWATSDATNAAIADGKLTIKVPNEKTTVTITVTVACGEATQTKEFTITLSKTATPIKDVVAIGSAKEHNTYTEEKYIIAGIITEIQNTTYGNMIVTDESGASILVYGTYLDGAKYGDFTGAKPVVGDYVVISGIVGQYNGTPQIKNGDITSFTTPTALKDAAAAGAAKEHNTYTDEKFLVAGKVVEIANTTYGNLYIEDAEGNRLYIYGLYDQANVRFDKMANQPAVGDTITVLSVAGQYNGTVQLKNATIVAIVKGTGETPTPHEHNFVEGKCECGAEDPNYQPPSGGETPAPHEHNFIEGKCECGATDPNYQPPHEHNYIDGKCECGAEDPNYQPPTGDGVMSIPEVLASAEGTAVVVKGTVSEIYQAWNDQFSNISFYIVDEAGNRLLVFRTGTLVGIGDQVTVTGKATLYNEVIQIAQGGVTVIDVVHVCSTFTEGSCIADTLCTVCGKVGTPAPGHDFVNGTCSVCGEAAPTVEQITASKTIKELITALGWTSSTTKQSFNLDDIVSVKINGGNNTGKAYEGDHIRIYATDTPAGTMTITVPEGYEIVSIKVSAKTGTYAFFNIDGVSGDVCNKTIEVDGNSVVLKSVKNGSDGKQVRVTAIEVVYQPVA